MAFLKATIEQTLQFVCDIQCVTSLRWLHSVKLLYSIHKDMQSLMVLRSVVLCTCVRACVRACVLCQLDQRLGLIMLIGFDSDRIPHNSQSQENWRQSLKLFCSIWGLSMLMHVCTSTHTRSHLHAPYCMMAGYYHSFLAVLIYVYIYVTDSWQTSALQKRWRRQWNTGVTWWQVPHILHVVF